MTGYGNSTRTVAARGLAVAWADRALGVDFVCAVVLFLAILAPGDLARTTWSEGATGLTDSPAGYVGIVTLCGLAALVALVAGASTRRWRIAAAFAAAAALAFAGAAFWAARYGRLVADGVMGLEGRIDTTGWSASATIDSPELLPFFVVVAVAGALAALVLTAAWSRWK